VSLRDLPTDLSELMIEETGELERFCEELRAAGRFSFDTEFIRERSYEPLVCLVQVSGVGRPALIDSLAVRDMTPFWELVADPEVEKVVHSGRQDLEMCHLGTGLTPANVFDVQLAAGLAGLPYPLGYGKLVDQVMGVRLNQSETFTDWSLRPLTPDQLRYAVEDVLYLPTVYEKLGDRLDDWGRRHWLREEMGPMETRDFYTREVEDPFLKVRGKGGLSRRQLAVLRELAEWREHAARRRDLPARSLLRDDALVETARRKPASVRDLRNLRGFPRPLAESEGEAILTAIQRGADVDDSQLPDIPAEREEWPGGKLLADLAAAVGQSLCMTGRLAPELFATRADYMELAEAVGRPGASAEPPKLLSGWRREFAGDALTAALSGKRAVRVGGNPRKPRIELVDWPAE